MDKMHPQLGGCHNNVHYNQCTTFFISPMSPFPKCAVTLLESFREKSPERTSKVLFSSEVDVRTHKSHQVLDLLTLFICSLEWTFNLKQWRHILIWSWRKTQNFTRTPGVATGED